MTPSGRVVVIGGGITALGLPTTWRAPVGGDAEIRDWTEALWDRAVAEFESPEFESLIDQAAGA